MVKCRVDGFLSQDMEQATLKMGGFSEMMSPIGQISNIPFGRSAAPHLACRQRFRGGVRRETRGNPEKTPLSGPSRTEAEHPQPQFGQVGLIKSLTHNKGDTCNP